MNVDLLKPGTVPMPPDTVLWFEFLLDPSLLEKHLAKSTPDPTPSELIVKFLAIAHEQKDPVVPEPIVIDGDQSETVQNGKAHIVNGSTHCNKKSLALKILALKVAAHLNWNMSILEKTLPLPMQQSLLLDLLQLCVERPPAPLQPIDITSCESVDLPALSPHALFAVTLYHRWILRALVYSELNAKQSAGAGSIYGPPNRPPHNANLNGANPQDGNVAPPAVVDELIRALEKQSADSLRILQWAVTLKPTRIYMPHFDTFRTLSEDSIDVAHNWDSSCVISTDEYRCQLHYDSGVYLFFRQDLKAASKHFQSTLSLLSSISGAAAKLSFCFVPSDELEGYCTACGIVTPNAPELSLLCQFQAAAKQQYTGIVGILVKDNIAREIPMVHRDQLELDIQGAVSSGKFTVARDLLLNVMCLNIARRLASGNLVSTDYAQCIRASWPRGVELLYTALLPIIENSSSDPDAGAACKQRVKSFLKGLHDEGVQVFENANAAATNLFEPEELAKITDKTEEELPSLLTSWNRAQVWSLGNPDLKLGTCQQQLILSYEPSEIDRLLMSIWNDAPAMKENMHSLIWDINSKWSLPIPLNSSLMLLPHGITRDRSYIMLAKAQELAAMQEYDRALELFAAVAKDLQSQTQIAGPVKFKINRLMCWEGLAIQAAQFLEEWPAFVSRDEGLAESCKSCLSARGSGETVLPRLEVMERCALLLLNVPQHHDVLSKLDHMCSLIDLTVAFATICQDLHKRHKSGRIVPKDAWDLIVPAFLTNGAQKRNSSGASVLHRDSPVMQSGLCLSSLWTFFCHLREPTVLSVAISLLARICNVLKDDSKSEITADYVNLWPNSIPNSSSYSFRAVTEMLYQLLGQALKYHPNDVGWLKILGDLNFVIGHHAAALKAYLEAAIASSDFFSQPLSKAVMTDVVFRRMIKCCSSLQCHTQAAVLCQFLEDVDYTQAFKSLGETKNGNSADAMDSYYGCIWDITLLEYLVHMHTKRGETHRKQMAVIGLLELNSNNNEEIQREAANVRKARFLRAMAHQYVC